LEKQTIRLWTVLGEINNMKTLRISDHAHRELTRWLGEMMAQTGKAQTFSDVIDALVSRAVLLPPELLKRVEEFIEANKEMGYTTREELIQEAVNEWLYETLHKSKLFHKP
jgi:predicted CopG family antitoxin